jgi:uncharacterized low-complexity protein
MTMKKFFLYVFLALAILAAIFTYILYSEGAFETYEPEPKSELKPFMKCEAGKCGAGKCETGKSETTEKSDLIPSMKCEAGKCSTGKCG